MEALAGMTVNERLYMRRLLPAWDKAVREKDRNAMIELLKQVELEEQAEKIVDSALRRTSQISK